MKLIVITGCLILAAASAMARVPASRLAVLDRGANISSLFETGRDLGPTLDRMKRDGFRHGRIFVLVEQMDDLDYRHKITRLLGEAVKRHFGIIICMTSRKPWTASSEMLWLATWKLLASDVSQFPPEYVFPEMANEPQIKEWDTVQSHLEQEVRAILPEQTIILTGSPLGMVWSLPEKPSSDGNVIYSFHEYQPMLITHQGAEWTPGYREFVGLVYPPEPANIRLYEQPETKERLETFREHGAELLKREIDQAARWSEASHIPVICDEFGVYHKAPLATRAAWLYEARSRLEGAKIGWTVWEYQGGFGVGPLLPSDSLAHALGLPN